MAVATLNELYRRVYVLLEENYQFYPEAEVRRALLNGLRWLNLCTGFLRTSATILLQPGQWLYNVPDQILLPIRIATESRRLERVTLDVLGAMNRNWLHEMESGRPGQTEYWAMFGIRRILIGYPPSSAAATAYIEGVADPRLPSGNSDPIELPSDYYDWLIHYAAADCMLKCGGVVARTAESLYGRLAAQIPRIIAARQNMARNIRAEIREPMAK